MNGHRPQGRQARPLYAIEDARAPRDARVGQSNAGLSERRAEALEPERAGAQPARPGDDADVTMAEFEKVPTGEEATVAVGHHHLRHGQLTQLAVDDDRVMRAVITRVLHGAGIDVVAVDVPQRGQSVADTEPGEKGDRVSGATKPATLETGHVIQIPEHISEDTKVSVDTRSGEFLGCALGNPDGVAVLCAVVTVPSSPSEARSSMPT